MNKIVDKVIGNTTTTPIPLNKNNIIDVEYESDRHTIDFSVIRNICKYYDAKGNEIDFSDPQARDKLHTGIYRIKVKSTWEMPEVDDDLNIIGYTKSDSYSEEILVQNVYRYSTKYPDFSVWRNGETIVYQYLFSGNLTEESLYRSATIKLDGSAEVYYEWANVLSRFEHTGSKVSDMSDFVSDEDNEILYPNIKAVKDYASPIIINTAEGSLVNITDSANAKLKGLKVCGKTTQHTTTGKNLLDISSNPIFVKQADGSYVNENGITNLSASFPMNLPEGTYTLSYDLVSPSGKNARIRINLTNGTYEERLVASTGDYIHYEHTIIGEIESWMIRSSAPCDEGTVAIKNAQLEVGSVATEYEPYTGGIASPNPNYQQPLVNVGDGGSVEIEIRDERVFNPFVQPQTFTLNTPNGLPGVLVTSGGNYTDENGQQWICNEIDLARGKYVQRVEKITLNSDTPISIDTPSETRTYAIAYISGISPYVVDSTGFGYCNKLVYGNYNNNDKQEQFYPYNNGRTKGFSISLHKARFDGTYTKAKVLEILGNDNVFIYAMAEPIETDLNLTEEEIAQYKALTTHKPVTNVFNDADAHMKVDYVADTKNYIDNKFAELQANILSIAK